jgi:hypothetical protein
MNKISDCKDIYYPIYIRHMEKGKVYKYDYL